MAGENDVFTILGKVGVDQGALDADLAQTEAKVKASANRQGQTWKEASDAARRAMAQRPGSEPGLASSKEGQWWSDPNLAGFADKAAGSINKLGAAGHSGTQSLRAMGHVVGGLIPGFGGMAIGAVQVALHLGVMAAAGLVAIEMFHKITGAIEETAKDQAELNKMMREADVEGLTKKYAELSEKARDAEQGIGGLLRRLVGVPSSAKVQAVIYAEELRKAYNSVEQEELRAIEIQKIEDAALVKANEESVRLAQTTRELGKARNELNVTNRRILGDEELAAKNRIRDDKAFQDRDKDAAIQAIFDQKMQQETDKFAAMRRAADEKERRDAAGDDEKNAQRDARRLDAEVKRIELEKTGIAAVNATVQARIESTRALEVADAAFNARRVEGTDKYLEAKQDAANKEVDLEKRAAEESFAIKRGKLQTLIAGGGPDVGKYREDLDTLAKEEESVYLGLAEKKKQIDIKSTQEAIETRKKETAEKIALADKEFSYRVAMGQKSFGAEIQQAKDAASDRERTSADRDAADLRGVALVKEANAAYFSLRKAMGQETIYGEIAAQKELNATYAAGSRLLIDGQTKVLNLQRQAREEAKSAYLDIAGEAAAELRQKSPGKKKFTASEVEKQADKIRERREDALSSYLGGGKADITDAFAGLSKREEYRKLDQKGGLAGALSTAVSDSFSGFADSTDQFGSAVSLFNRTIADLVGQQAVQRMGSTSAYLQDPSKNKMSEDIGRQNYLENKRGPVFNAATGESGGGAGEA